MCGALCRPSLRKLLPPSASSLAGSPKFPQQLILMLTHCGSGLWVVGRGAHEPRRRHWLQQAADLHQDAALL